MRKYIDKKMNQEKPSEGLRNSKSLKNIYTLCAGLMQMQTPCGVHLVPYQFMG